MLKLSFRYRRKGDWGGRKGHNQKVVFHRAPKPEANNPGRRHSRKIVKKIIMNLGVPQHHFTRARPCQDCILALFEGKVLQREAHAQKLRLTKAHFPVLKTLDSFDFTAIPSLNKAMVLELSRGGYIDKRENIICIVSYGTGKTHLAISLGVCACRQGKRVRFYTAINLSNELLEAQSQLRLSKLEASLARYDLIILDELGFIPFSKEGAEFLSSLYASKYELGLLIVTIDLEPAGKQYSAMKP